jgi:16S rRNA (adenine1518-N6/adenine1519-N6)-dimethyltransferase
VSAASFNDTRERSVSPAAGGDTRERIRAALQALGHPPDARAEVLAPDEWRALYEALR